MPWSKLLGPVLGALALVAALGYWRLTPASPRRSAPVEYIRTARVRTGPLERVLRVTGVVAAQQFVTLVAPRLPGGRGAGHHEFRLILQKVAEPGARVRKGDVVAEFDPQYMLNRLDDYRAAVVQHELYIDKLKAQLDVTRKAYERRIQAAKARMDKASLDLKTAPVRSAIQIERFKLNLEEARAQHRELVRDVKFVDISEMAALRRSELDLRVTRLEMQRAEANVGRMIVRAPIDGVAVLRTIQLGADTVEIKPGDQLGSGHVFMHLMDPRSLVLEAWVNQADAEELRVGLKARVHLDAFPGQSLAGRVTSVGAIARGGSVRASFLKQIPVRLKIERPDARVLPNFTASADVILAAEKETTLVPREAVFPGRGGRAPVAYVQVAGGWEKRPLELGLANNVSVSVRSGLRAGEPAALARPAVE